MHSKVRIAYVVAIQPIHFCFTFRLLVAMQLQAAEDKAVDPKSGANVMKGISKIQKP